MGHKNTCYCTNFSFIFICGDKFNLQGLFLVIMALLAKFAKISTILKLVALRYIKLYNIMKVSRTTMEWAYAVIKENELTRSVIILWDKVQQFTMHSEWMQRL